MLKDWKVKQKEKLEEFTKKTDELQIIQSTPITITKNMIDKKFKQILERDKDLKKIRIHDLRHSHCIITYKSRRRLSCCQRKIRTCIYYNNN